MDIYEVLRGALCSPRRTGDRFKKKKRVHQKPKMMDYDGVNIVTSTRIGRAV